MLMLNGLLGSMKRELRRQEGHSRRQARLVPVPDGRGRQGRSERYARRPQRLAGDQRIAEGGGRLPASSSREARQPAHRGRARLLHPDREGHAGCDQATRSCASSPRTSRTRSTTRIFYDQMLGPSVGAVVNDISADLAAGRIKPAGSAPRRCSRPGNSRTSPTDPRRAGPARSPPKRSRAWRRPMSRAGANGGPSSRRPPGCAAARRHRAAAPRSFSCSCRRRCSSSRSSSRCRWARRPGTASTTGTATARRRSSSAGATSSCCSRPAPSASR